MKLKIVFIASCMSVLLALLSFVAVVEIEKRNQEIEILSLTLKENHSEISKLKNQKTLLKREVEFLSQSNEDFKEKIDNHIDFLKQAIFTLENLNFKGLTKVSGYNLSEQSCGKSKTHPQYGMTRYGFDLSGKSREEAMTIASNVYEKGTKLLIVFNGEFENYSGIYTVRDTGNPIYLQDRIDLFMGEDYPTEKIMNDFGLQEAIVFKLNE